MVRKSLPLSNKPNTIEMKSNIIKLGNTNDTTADTSYTVVAGQYNEKGGTIRDIYNALLKKHSNLRRNDFNTSAKTTISSNTITSMQGNTSNNTILIPKMDISKNKIQTRLHLKLPKPNVSIE